jgi:6-phosphogluconate dehydrogenase
MQVGMIGLGKMGSNMTRRLMRAGHAVVVHDRDPEAMVVAAAEGARGTGSLLELVEALLPPRAVWVMVPSGGPTETVIAEVGGLLQAGDVLVDGGNSNFKDTLRRAALLGGKRIGFLDAGVSGGVWGLDNGYSLMVGGEAEAVERLRPVLEALAPSPTAGWGHVGPSGAGHYAKMVHNGVEYGLMQAYAEGFEILRASRFSPDLKQLCDIWGAGSVVRSWLLELAGRAFAEDPDLASLKGFVPDSGEGRWTLEESVDLDVPAPVLYAALMTRFRSRQESAFQAKVLAALRHQFGGHATRKAGSP